MLNQAPDKIGLEIARRLEKSGQAEAARQIQDEISASSTGIELIMRLGWTLKQLQRAAPDQETADMIKDLIHTIDDHLK
jgi:thioredoxin-like negative regulator of GroEL